MLKKRKASNQKAYSDQVFSTNTRSIRRHDSQQASTQKHRSEAKHLIDEAFGQNFDDDEDQESIEALNEIYESTFMRN